MKRIVFCFAPLVSAALLLPSCTVFRNIVNEPPTETDRTSSEENTEEVCKEVFEETETFPTLSDIPDYVGEPYAVLHDNLPYFTEDAVRAVSFEQYSDLDALGRCGTAYACLSTELMPTEKRTSIGSVKPSGWHTAKYDIVDGGYLYNRCHLIGFQLAGENANPNNLITGTRYMNVEGMLPFENMTADYIKETENHVLYRVTPFYDGENLVANGVLMEALSVEDNGEELAFCVFCYNVQPGIQIDYATGESERAENTSYNHPTGIFSEEEAENTAYGLNTKTKKIHRTSCPSVADIKEENYTEYTGDLTEWIKKGYSFCQNCNPS